MNMYENLKKTKGIQDNSMSKYISVYLFKRILQSEKQTTNSFTLQTHMHLTDKNNRGHKTIYTVQLHLVGKIIFQLIYNSINI
jgi:hypothetical protein